VSVASVNDRFVRISVADTGKGIPLEKQTELFQAFSRLGLENSGIEGTGIGLSITKQLIERMEGAIGVESEEGKGSTFWLDIPGKAVDRADSVYAIDAVKSAQRNDEDDAAVQPEPESTFSKTVLYVEDNPANLSLMEMIISRTDGIDMISAFNAEIGIDMARTQKPDIILLDINLPGMGGLEALKILKGTEESTKTPIIAVSAAASKKDIDTAMEAGFDAYLTKPINVQQLLTELKNRLGIE
jgi:CheY-like chemotaxis protein